MGYQFDFGALSEYFGLFVEGTAVTLGLTVVASILGLSLGVGGAAASLSGIAWLKGLIATYVELIRNSPFIVQMFFVFYGLPGLGFKLSASEAAILAMTVNVAAYEIYSCIPTCFFGTRRNCPDCLAGCSSRFRPFDIGAGCRCHGCR